jgi:hypothetical protein
MVSFELKELIIFSYYLRSIKLILILISFNTQERVRLKRLDD